MRGGEIFIRDNAGYRAGIHMKAYKQYKPVIVIGGRVRQLSGRIPGRRADFWCWYLHTDGRPIVHFFPCTGMHGGKMVFRGDVSSIRFPDQVTLHNATAEDMEEITPYVREYCRLFDRDAEAMLRDNYTVITPDSKNPYQQMYVAN